MLLLDKGYFDYDYEKTEAPVQYREKSDEELRNTLAGFGFSQFAEKEPETDEKVQDYIIKQMEDK